MYASSTYSSYKKTSRTHADQLNRIRNLAIFLDTKFKGPMGIKFGWDGLIGLVPGIGDIFTNLLSFYIIGHAAVFGASPAILIRMCWNVLVDNFLDMIPFLGIFFDFFWKSNIKNLKLMEDYLEDPKSTRNKSYFVVAFILLSFFALVGGLVALGVWLITYAISIIF